MIRLCFALIILGRTTLSLPQGGGKCTSSADCIAPNVCSKWGWCQWTKIYGDEGPSQGSSAPDGGRAGQCTTSKDCAPRVPYCSKLGFCHGGVIPFDEDQLEIDPQVQQTSPEDQPYGFLNNDPRKNSPIFKQGATGAAKAASNQSQNKQATNGASSPQGNNHAGGAGKSKNNQRAGSGSNPGQGSGSSCQGGSLESCIESCPTQGYSNCVTSCGETC